MISESLSRFLPNRCYILCTTYIFFIVNVECNNIRWNQLVPTGFDVHHSRDSNSRSSVWQAVNLPLGCYCLSKHCDSIWVHFLKFWMHKIRLIPVICEILSLSNIVKYVYKLPNSRTPAPFKSEVAGVQPVGKLKSSILWQSALWISSQNILSRLIIVSYFWKGRMRHRYMFYLPFELFITLNRR